MKKLLWYLFLVVLGFVSATVVKSCTTAVLS